MTVKLEDIDFNPFESIEEYEYSPSSPDYDMAGYVAKYGKPDQSKGQHLTDEFKLPNHITFSVDSKYSKPGQEGGIWKNLKGVWHYAPSDFVLSQHPASELHKYFAKYEKDSVLDLPTTSLKPNTPTSLRLESVEGNPFEKAAPESEQGTFVGALQPELEWAVNTKANIPQSAWEYTKNMAHGLAHPFQTATVLGQLLAGGAEKAMGQETERTKMFNAAAEGFKQRYGGYENFMKTVEKDPVGTLGDISALISLGAGGAAKVAKLGGLEGAAGVLSDVGKMGAAIDPAGMVSSAIGKATHAALTPMASGMYRSAVKMSKTLPIEVREAVTKFALDQRFVPTLKRYDKLVGEIDGLTKQADAVVSAFQQNNPGTTITVDQLFTGLDKIRENAALTGKHKTVDAFMRRLIEGNSQVINIGGVKARALKMLTPEEVQKLKRRITQEVENSYLKMLRPVGTELRQKVASNAKEMIESWVPEIKQINADNSVRIGLRKAIQNSVKRIQDRDLLSLGAAARTGIAVEVGRAVDINPRQSTIAGILMSVLDAPKTKAAIAVALHEINRRGIALSPRSRNILEAIRQGDIQAGQIEGQSPEDFVPSKTATIPIEKVGNIVE